ncbi:MAG: hypothetical protein JNM86_08475 [Phycisphaerae bacterium]|nr:hypothetical protein [Phycisphaerae bacterium]
MKKQSIIDPRTGLLHDPISDAIATLTFDCAEFESTVRKLAESPSIEDVSFGRPIDSPPGAVASTTTLPERVPSRRRRSEATPERRLGQVLSDLRTELSEQVPEFTAPQACGDVWQDRAALLAALRKFQAEQGISPEHALSDAEKLIATALERAESGSDANTLQRLYGFARERCEWVREFVPACGPLPTEPPLSIDAARGEWNVPADYSPPVPPRPEPIVAAINALREWTSGARPVAARSASTEEIDLRTAAQIVAEFEVSDSTLREDMDRKRLRDFRKRGHGKTAPLLIDRNAAKWLYGVRPNAEKRLAEVNARRKPKHTAPTAGPPQGNVPPRAAPIAR